MTLYMRIQKWGWTQVSKKHLKKISFDSKLSKTRLVSKNVKYGGFDYLMPFKK